MMLLHNLIREGLKHYKGVGFSGDVGHQGVSQVQILKDIFVSENFKYITFYI